MWHNEQQKFLILVNYIHIILEKNEKRKLIVTRRYKKINFDL
jgi:hypothetical protein